MTIACLAVLFCAAVIYVGRRKSLRTVMTLLMNAAVFIVCAAAISSGVNPILSALLSCLVITALIVFYNNGVNIKSTSAFASVLVTLVLLGIAVAALSNAADISGFSYIDFEQIESYSFYISINMLHLTTACILVGLIGATADTAVAVSSALYEVYRNNPSLSIRSLVRSGMTVGHDIMGTTANTLFFAMLGEGSSLFVWYRIHGYSFIKMLNASAFCQEYLRIALSALGCVIIIPVTVIITARLITRTNKKDMP